MKITARCHPALAPLLPRPVPGAQMLPSWLAEMPSQVGIGADRMPSLKHCDFVTGAMGLGILILLPTDVVIGRGEVTWNWDLPLLPDSGLPRAPVGPYAPERAQGSPYSAGKVMIRFMNFWMLQPPQGHALLVSHPHGFPDLPFHTLTGRIQEPGQYPSQYPGQDPSHGSGDRLHSGLHGGGRGQYVHFPAALDPGFEGRIAKGTPVAQILPVPNRVEIEA